MTLIAAILLGACHERDTLFESIPSSRSGISFNNRITESDSLNPMSVVNIYNGGGVGIGDFNNDGRPDIYFTGNEVSSQLYLNKGNFQFANVTETAGVGGEGRWGRGVAVIDINNDGLADIYVCNSIYKDSLRRRNILYVNQGPDKNGVPHFKDMAADYGLELSFQSTMAYFFDYDNDGDLDMYLAINTASNENNPSVFRQVQQPVPSMGRLYRNDMDSGRRHPVFTDVSAAAGIRYEGFGHAASICDINDDGWKDIYVSDDFLSNNILYINNHDGTFTNRTKEYFKHTSYNSMGQDVADINNDGLPDVVELDMNPEDNYRKKMMLAPGNYEVYKNFEFYGYQYQFVRNTLQLNQGPAIHENDSVGIPAFSEIGFMAGIGQTDWSWAPLLADFDNDSYRDLIVTNGFPRDVSDHDFIAYRERSSGLAGTQTLLDQIPQVKLHNYGFHNNGNLGFSDSSADWGLSIPTFSNGAAYADLDNDGNLDLIVNNINDEALIYRNRSAERNKDLHHYIDIKFSGNKENRNGLGAKVNLYYAGNKQQSGENNPYRGYLSSVAPGLHFGLGPYAAIDSLVVRWSDGRSQRLSAVKTNQVLVLNIDSAGRQCSPGPRGMANKALFSEATAKYGVSYRNYGTDFIDFGIQVLLPHQFSDYCPAVAAADLNGDGLDDMIVGGDAAYPAQLLYQQINGRFAQHPFPVGVQDPDVSKNYKDEGILIFDANSDGKADVCITAGGYRLAAGSKAYQDRLYINDGKGVFHCDTLALPVNHASKFCVRSFDYNGDGKPDLFVSARVEPWSYPKPVSCYIYRNDSDKDHVRFTDVTVEVAPGLQKIGMVCDALITDFNDDGQQDLILAGEWMPVTFFQNVNGKFQNVTAATGLAGATGWWNSIVGGDFRHTGRTDYIVGNAGLNTLYQASTRYPVSVTAKNFGNGGTYLPVMSLFLKDSAGMMNEFPAVGRDEISRQFPGIKKRFPNYRSFANEKMDQLFPDSDRLGAIRLQATMLQSCFVRNDGNGKFKLIPLPREAQVSVIDGMIADDFDGDGMLDVLLTGNDYGTDVSIGRNDAFNGLLMKGDGRGGFTPLSPAGSGFFVPGNAKALVSLPGKDGRMLVAASQNRDILKLFELRKDKRILRVEPDDQFAILNFENGQIEKKELNQTTSFLSQSTSALFLGDQIHSVRITNRKGKSRTVPISR